MIGKLFTGGVKGPFDNWFRDPVRVFFEEAKEGSDIGDQTAALCFDKEAGGAKSFQSANAPRDFTSFPLVNEDSPDAPVEGGLDNGSFARIQLDGEEWIDRRGRNDFVGRGQNPRGIILPLRPFGEDRTGNDGMVELA